MRGREEGGREGGSTIQQAIANLELEQPFRMVRGDVCLCEREGGKEEGDREGRREVGEREGGRGEEGGERREAGWEEKGGEKGGTGLVSC